MWENGSCKLKNSEAGMTGVSEVKVITQSCFATEIRGPAGHSSGNKDRSRGREEREPVLTGRGVSSLVVDRLGDQAGDQNTAVACFYFDFAARKEQSAASMLGSLLKQIVSGMERIPEEISQAFQKQKKVIGGRNSLIP